ncbi:MAG: argininosuccinate synthase [Clostridiales Family XIII bacterium]|jgi:argininosuccinate synthase|nr:argininosuccinate synthase [Clostridiales Family XIII bacterium]
MPKEKIVLAYSGGLDTSIILTWLKENYDAEIIAADADVGQDDDFAAIEKKAFATGADKCYILDLKDEFVEGYIWPVVKAGAAYEDDYLLGTSMARPLIAEKLVEIARKEGAKYISHGATGKGNDQVRFEATIHALDPSIKIIAPWRIWDFRSREDLLAYAAAHNIPVEQSAEKIYSRDQNLWHISHEGGNLESPWNEHRDDVHVMSVPIEQAPDDPAFVEIEFEKGVPVAIDGERLPAAALLTALNKIGGVHGVGTIDIVENRLVGMKSRGVYETPGGTIIMNAHKALEKLVLDRETLYEKGQIARRYAQIVYDGRWFTPLREAIDAFVDKTQEVVTGTVRMELYKGNALAAASKAPASLYSEEFATFGEDEVYNQKDAEGFINLFSLSMKIRAIQKRQG